MQTGAPQDFITFKSFGTFAGASGITYVLANTARKLVKSNSPWLPFLCAEAVAFIGSYYLGSLTNVGQGLLTALNGCLLFLTASGAQEGIASAATSAGGAKAHGAEPVRWLGSWFR
jgi:hypothetical protein